VERKRRGANQRPKGPRPPRGRTGGALLRAALRAAPLVLLAACPWPGSGPDCRPISDAAPLPVGLEESSGVAVSRSHPGVFWTHDDGAAPYLFAVDASGALIGRVRLDAPPLVDWEDLEIAACGAQHCLYAADTGDNFLRRDTLRILRFPEPDPRRDTVVTVEVLDVLLPDGPRDIEALFVLPGERLHLVSKGGESSVSVYRAPTPVRFGEGAVTFEEVQRLSEGPRVLPRQVTGASATPDGEGVVVRTYETLHLHRVRGDTLVAIEGGTVNLRTLREAQGEGVGVGDDGVIALTSEAGPFGQQGSIQLLRCGW